MKGPLLSCLMMAVWTSWMIGEMPALSAEQKSGKGEMKRILPRVLEGYQWDGKDEFYDFNTAFRYMDGAAELYRSYHFKLLLVRRYVKAGHPSILVELFDMGSSEEAFGVFSYQSGEEEVAIGQGSDYGGGLLRFWKGRYFANVYAEKETSDAKKDILLLAETIAKNMRVGPKPNLIRFLPKEDLMENSLRYFHSHHVLNHHYFLSYENILHLGPKTRAVLATYSPAPEKGKTRLLLVHYPSTIEAQRAYNHFLQTYLPEAGATAGPVKIENGRWSAAKLHQRYVIGVFEASSEEEAKRRLDATQRNIVGR